jgi:hypothetical protein
MMNSTLEVAEAPPRGEEWSNQDWDIPADRQQIEAPIIARALRDRGFRRDLLLNPKKIMERELSAILGKQVALPDDYELRVVEESPNVGYIVLPANVPSTSPAFRPGDSELDWRKGVTYYCTTVGCKPGFSC